MLTVACFSDDYTRDILYPARAKVVPAVIPQDVDPMSVDALKYAAETFVASKQKGINIRVIILCNPHNPLARCYPVETIVAYAKFAQEVCESIL